MTLTTKHTLRDASESKQDKSCQTSFRKIVNASPTYGTETSGTNSLTGSTSEASLTGLNIRGPFPFTISKGIFIPERGVRMSENSITW